MMNFCFRNLDELKFIMSGNFENDYADLSSEENKTGFILDTHKPNGKHKPEQYFCDTH